MLSLVAAGDHVLVSRNTYGGTYRFFSKVLANFGVTFAYVDTTDVEAVRKAVTPATRMLFVETPTNPTMEISDLEALADLARGEEARIGAKIRVVVDNTFATPFFQRPLALGCDVVVHSTTKYLNGHSDSVGGAVICADAEDGDEDRLHPERGRRHPVAVRLLPRLARHQDAARAHAGARRERPRRGRVARAAPEGDEGLLPGSPAHPGHAVASRQMSGFGGMISFDLGSQEAAKRLLDRVVVCALGESLGGVESLISHPATMTHASVEPDERARRGITPGLVRVSVGIEDVEDILLDLGRALDGV